MKMRGCTRNDAGPDWSAWRPPCGLELFNSCPYFLSPQRGGFEAVINVCGEGVNGLCVWILTIMADILRCNCM